ncbi:MAG: ABC transporter permease, partial [Acidobacteriota bacterium]
MDRLRQDLRHAVRSLSRSPGFTAAAVLTLALGIGATTAIFGVVDAVLLKPFGLPDEDRLVTVWQDESAGGGPVKEWTGRSVFAAWRDGAGPDGAGSFDALSVVTDWRPDVTIGDRPETLSGAAVSSDYFDVVGVRPARGRGFLPEEDVEGNDRVLVLSHALWQRRFRGDPGLIGRALTVGGEPYTVVGIMPEGFRGPLEPQAELWTVLATRGVREDWGSYYLRTAGRLAPETSTGAAEASLERVMDRLGATHPADYAETGVTLEPLRETVIGPARTPLVAVFGAVLFVLLIACVNVANLMLVRAGDRERELAVRTALGAGRGTLVRQLLVESLVLAAGGGAVGLLVGAWGIDLIRLSIPPVMPRIEGLGLDGSVLFFVLGVTLGTGVLFGLAPALLVSRSRITAGLHQGGRSGGGGRSRLRSVLVVAEVALGLALLVGAGLLIRSFDALTRVDPGFRPDGVLSARMTFPSARFPERQRVAGFVDEVVDRLEARPEVTSAGAVSVMPLSGNQHDVSFAVEGRIPEPGREPATDYRVATPGYFRTLGIPLVRGRLFAESDDGGATRVALINERFAERYFPGEDPIGRRVRIGNVRSDDSPWWTVVGIVGSVRDNALDRAPDAEAYVPAAQRASRAMTLVVRSGRPPETLAEPLRAAVHAVDPEQAVSGVVPVRELVSSSLAPARFLAGLLGAFAVLALVLAAVGIYGVMAYSVGRRTREIGVRMALGARPGDVLALVLRQGALLAGLGLALGLFLAYSLTRSLGSLLFEISPHDPATFGGVALVLAAATL